MTENRTGDQTLMKLSERTMKTFFTMLLVTVAVHMSSAGPLRDETGQDDIPPLPEVPVEVPQVPEVPARENKVVVQAEEQSNELDEEQKAKVPAYDPNTEVEEGFIITPEEKLYSEFAENPDFFLHVPVEFHNHMF